MNILEDRFDDLEGIDDFGSSCIRWSVSDGCNFVIRLYRPDNVVAVFSGTNIVFMKTYSCYSSAIRAVRRLQNKYFGGAQ